LIFSKFLLYLPEDSKFKPSGKKKLLAVVAKNVEISCKLREARGKQFLIIDALKVLLVEKNLDPNQKKSS